MDLNWTLQFILYICVIENFEETLFKRRNLPHIQFEPKSIYTRISLNSNPLLLL
jgi:hypothetical protein